MSVRYLDLADYLVIAEAVLGVPGEVLALSTNLHLADSALNAPSASYGGHELYPGFAQKAAVLCWRLCNNHPLFDGNKRVAYEALREFVARNGVIWLDPPDDGPYGDETVKMMWDVAAGRVGLEEFTRWITARVGDNP